jgi:isochorismate synthase
MLEQFPQMSAPSADVQPFVYGDIDDARGRDAWRTAARVALDAIEHGDASKIVLARSARLTLAQTARTTSLARTLTSAEGSYRFVARRSEMIFAGATPERLVEKRGDLVRTEAVAGTAPAEHHDTPLEEREKDRREHLAVVLAIDEALVPLVQAMEHADAPVVRRHGPVAHLVTPFEGRVLRRIHVLDLADALHPTPAVAGTPRDAALDFIAAHEGIARGWYAGPIGWFDLNGDGELAVALRCVRIDDKDLHVYAGAGIVAGSDPDAEFDETRLKMRAALGALGFQLQPAS